MAVVETLSVILQAITGDFGKGLKNAGKDTQQFEKQIKSTQRTLAGFRASVKGSFGAISGKLGLGGVFGGALGGFTFAKFASESLKEAAKDNKELQASLTELDATFIQIKKNFGAWMVEVAGAGSIIDGFNAKLKQLSGENINAAQASVNVGHLDATRPRDVMDALNAIDARQKQLASQTSDPAIKQAFDAGEKERLALLERVRQLQAQGEFTKESLSLLDLGQVSNHLERQFLPTVKALGTQGGQAWDLFTNGARAALSEMKNLEKGITDTLADLKAQAKADAMAVIESTKTPLEEFNEQFARLKFLKQQGFLTPDQAAAGLAAARQGLDQFRLDPVERMAGARRGSLAAFNKVADFRSQGTTRMENTWEKILARAEEQARLTKQSNDLLKQAFGTTKTVDTKP